MPPAVPGDAYVKACTMSFQLSFWFGVTCFAVFSIGVLVRLPGLWRSPSARFEIGEKWAFLDALGPLGFVFLDIWIYQDGEASFAWIMAISMVITYYTAVRQRRNEGDTGGGAQVAEK